MNCFVTPWLCTEQTLQPLISCLIRFRLFPFRSPLLGESILFLFLRVLRCFTSPGLLLIPYVFREGYSRFTGIGCPIRKSPDQSLLAAPRGLSQLATSFIAS